MLVLAFWLPTHSDILPIQGVIVWLISLLPFFLCLEMGNGIFISLPSKTRAAGEP